MPYEDLGSAEASIPLGHVPSGYGLLPSEGVVALSSLVKTLLNCSFNIVALIFDHYR